VTTKITVSTLLKVYPSSLTFSFEDYNPATKSSQCWRYAQLSQGARGPDIHPDYMTIGNQNEVEHEATLTDYEREKPFRRDLGGAVLSGRVDFLLKDSIDECKATFKKQVLTDAERGKPDPGHLAQLTCYLLQFDLRHGRLIYGWYTQKLDGTFHRSKVVELAVTIEDGSVLVNGADTGYKAADIANSIVRLTKYLQSDLPAPKPSTASNSFGSPCTYCPLKTLCSRVDSENLTIPEVRDEARGLVVNQQPGPAPKPTKYKG
jgi:hypothetical protein